MKPQLSVRSAKAKDLAHRLAQRERRTVASIVELALEEYEARHSDRTSAADFYRKLAHENAVDSELDILLETSRNPHPAVPL
jgi:hypothetical protein